MASTSKKKTVTKVAAKKKVTKKKAAPKAAASEKVITKKTVKKKAASTSKAAPKKAAKKSAKSVKTDTSMMDITPKERWKMVAVAAYHKAEKRGFAPGHDLQDWIDAEKEIAAFLQD